MRTAVVTLALAALAVTTAHAAGVSKAKAAPRALVVDAGACKAAVVQFGQCWHGTYDSPAARSAACCPSINALMSSCGSNLYESFENIMGLGSQVPANGFLSYLADFRGFMDGIGSCPRMRSNSLCTRHIRGGS